jgi:hypothetical protein
MSAQSLAVTVSRGSDLTWVVRMGEKLVGRFLVTGDALAYATLLECDPRVRREATRG